MITVGFGRPLVHVAKASARVAVSDYRAITRELTCGLFIDEHTNSGCGLKLTTSYSHHSLKHKDYRNKKAAGKGCGLVVVLDRSRRFLYQSQ